MTSFLCQLPITFQFDRSRALMRLSHIREVISLKPSWVQKIFSVAVRFLSPCEKTPEVKPQNFFFLSVHLSNGSKYLLFNLLYLNKTYICCGETVFTVKECNSETKKLVICSLLTIFPRSYARVLPTQGL